MKFFFGLLLGLLVAIGIAAAALKVAWGGVTDIRFDDDDAAKLTQVREATGFDRINVAGVFDLDVAVGGDYSVEIRGSQKALDRAEISVVDGELILDIGQTKLEGGRKVLRGGLAAKVTLPALTAVEIAGVVDGDVRGIAADEFTVDFSGVGELELEGSCVTLKANMSGVGDLDASDLKCQTVEVDVSGVGEASVYASSAVEASISGIGNISVDGSPSDVSKQKGGPFARISVR